MVALDIGIAVIVLVSTLISLIRGFVREALSLALWVIAIGVAWSFFRDVSAYLTPWIDTAQLRYGLAFVALLLITLFVGGLFNFLLMQLVQRTGMSGTDRLIGMVFGFARGIILVSVLALLAGLTPLPENPWWRDSLFVPYFQELAFWLRELLPAEIAERFHYAALGRRFS